MSETTARDKFACSACGAEAIWDPAKKALVCPYCATVSSAKLKTEGEIQERDLLSALANLSEESQGWQAEKTSVKCRSCQAISVFDPTRVAQRCDFCGSAALIPVEEMKAPIRPESLLEFQVDETKVRELVRSWYGSRWFAPNALNARALTDTVRGVYIPYWTFDARVSARWNALSGYYYYESEVYTDSEGRQQTRQVRHTRWEPSRGSLAHTFDDELVSASTGVDRELLAKVEPFPTRSELKPYEPGFLAGWVVEQYQVDLGAAARDAQERMDNVVRDLCRGQVPGDTHTSLEVDAEYAGQTFKHVLVPVWVVAYNYGSKTYQVIVNGYTASIAGKHPLSWVKITLLVLAILLLLLVLGMAGSLWYVTGQHRPY